MPRAAGHKPARPPGMETDPEGRTKMVRRPSAKKTLHGFERAGPLAAAVLPGRAAKQLAAGSHAAPLQLGIPADAARGPPVAAIKVPRWHRQEWWKRGGLVGLSPEALCEEAPKGQPMIRREHLVAVRVEDPQGHPRIHSCPRPRKPRPSGKRKGRREQSGPPSSRLTKAALKERGGRSPEQLHGKRDASGRSRKETPRSSSRRAL